MNVDEPYFIDKHNKDVKKILKKQGNRACRDKIHEKTLLNSIHKFDYGFVILKNKAIIGSIKKNSSDKFLLVSFILFKIDYIDDKKYIFIDLLCSDEKYKKENYGKILLEKCFEYALNNDIDYVQLHALNEVKLIEWYMNNGFSVVSPIKINDTIKVYIMEKNLKK